MYKRQKQRLALKALDFLEKDQLVAIDGSSTNLQFAKNIPNGLKLTVLTNSYSIAHACSMKEQVNVIVLGGNLLKESMTNVGETAASQASLYHPDLCFMGVYAIHPEYGMTIPYPDEVADANEDMVPIEMGVYKYPVLSGCRETCLLYTSRCV